MKATELQTGMVIDVDRPDVTFASETDREAAKYEYIEVESVNGGWADGALTPGHVMIYNEGLGNPVMVPADAEFEEVKP